MKRFWFCLLVAAVCACSKDNDINIANVESSVTFTATIENSAETRTSVGEKNDDGTFPILWSRKDSISVFDIGSAPANNRFIIKNGEYTDEATFTGSCAASDNGYIGIYPYYATSRVAAGTSVYSSTIPWNGIEQTACKGSWDPTKALMMAYAESAEKVSLSFKTICAYIKFTTDYPCKSVVFASNDDSYRVACEYIRAAYRKDSFEILSCQGPSSSLTLAAGESGIIEPGTYYIAVLPCYLKEGFTMTFQSVKKESKTCTRSTNKSVTLNAGHVLNLGTLDIGKDLVTFLGSGTEDDPYQISDLQELKYLATVTNAGIEDFLNPYYIQTADIDCNGETLTPIGNNQYMFAGKYNGNGKKITNAVFDHFQSDGKAASGLFGNIYNATIKNLTIEDCTVKDLGCSENPAIVFGVLAAHAYSTGDYSCTITNCNTSGTVTYDSDKEDCGAYQVGGLIGATNANMDITCCTTNVTFKSLHITALEDASMGGIIGFSGPVKYKPGDSNAAHARVHIDRCRNTGNLSYYIGNADNDSDVSIGGIIGRLYDAWTSSYKVSAVISNCVNNGDIAENYITNSHVYLGGIIGNNDAVGAATSGDLRPDLLNCLNTGNITCAAKKGYIGGIIGYNYTNYIRVRLCINQDSYELVSDNDLAVYGICATEAGTYLSVFNLNFGVKMLTPSMNYGDGDGGSTGIDSGTWDIPLWQLKVLINTCYKDLDLATWTRGSSADGAVYDLKI